MKDLFYGFGPAARGGNEILQVQYDEDAERERQVFACYLRFLAAVYYPDLHVARRGSARRRRIQQKRVAARLRPALKLRIPPPFPA